MISLLLFLSFLKIGTFTFGGGHAMIPLIKEEVLKKGWMDLEELINFIAISESTPGPFAINIATFVGYKVSGAIGALCATIGVIVTSFFVILIIAKCFEKYKKNKVIKYCMEGLKPVIIGLIGSAVITIGISVFFQNQNVLYTISTVEFWKSISIFISMIILTIKKVHPIIIILSAALLGIVLGFI